LLIQSGYAFLNFAIREQAGIFGKTEIRHYKMREKEEGRRRRRAKADALSRTGRLG
jgi:hypothetical protein